VLPAAPPVPSPLLAVPPTPGSWKPVVPPLPVAAPSNFLVLPPAPSAVPMTLPPQEQSATALENAAIKIIDLERSMGNSSMRPPE
jgi:hypothetical protein